MLFYWSLFCFILFSFPLSYLILFDFVVFWRLFDFTFTATGTRTAAAAALFLLTLSLLLLPLPLPNYFFAFLQFLRCYHGSKLTTAAACLFLTFLPLLLRLYRAKRFKLLLLQLLAIYFLMFLVMYFQLKDLATAADYFVITNISAVAVGSSSLLSVYCSTITAATTDVYVCSQCFRLISL